MVAVESDDHGMDASCADLAEPDAVECGRGEGGVTDGGPVVRRHAPDGVAPVQCVLKVRPLVTVCLVTKVDPPPLRSKTKVLEAPARVRMI